MTGALAVEQMATESSFSNFHSSATVPLPRVPGCVHWGLFTGSEASQAHSQLWSYVFRLAMSYGTTPLHPHGPGTILAAKDPSPHIR